MDSHLVVCEAPEVQRTGTDLEQWAAQVERAIDYYPSEVNLPPLYLEHIKWMMLHDFSLCATSLRLHPLDMDGRYSSSARTWILLNILNYVSWQRMETEVDEGSRPELSFIPLFPTKYVPAHFILPLVFKQGMWYLRFKRDQLWITFMWSQPRVYTSSSRVFAVQECCSHVPPDMHKAFVDACTSANAQYKSTSTNKKANVHTSPPCPPRHEYQSASVRSSSSGQRRESRTFGSHGKRRETLWWGWW